MKVRTSFIFAILLISSLAVSDGINQTEAEKKAGEFLTMYDSLYQKMYAVDAEANWVASTDVSETHTGQRIGADSAYAAFLGNGYIINRAQELLKEKNQLTPITVRQLERILYNGAQAPGTVPDIVTARITAEAKQSATLDGFQFCAEGEGDNCVKAVTPNQIDDALQKFTDLAERKKIWEVSKQSGVALKPGLVELQRLRNQIAAETGFKSYFALEVSDYGMTVPEMMTLLQKIVTDMKPLYQQLHCWTKHKLAERYRQPVPNLIPAQWLGNRWSQQWPGIVEGIDLDGLFKEKSPEWMIQQAERFYVSMGMPKLPETFWTKSDLYDLPPDSKRKKNTHASAWHMDLEKDVRSLMSVKPDMRWFSTTHHELGHIYYYLAYSNPDVALTLRRGANRGFHEAIGYLIKISSEQPAYMREIGLLAPDKKIDQTQWLLNQALDEVVFIPWSAGVMSGWEHDFYEERLSPAEYNKRWWSYVAKYQGVEPPDSRGEEYCDAATKTHINDDPAQYYDYALAFVIKYQLHDYIAKNILKQDPRNCNYYGNKEVGKFLWDLLKMGATRDWREVIKEKTGEEISTRAMLDYYRPVLAYLQKANKGRTVSWE